MDFAIFRRLLKNGLMQKWLVAVQALLFSATLFAQGPSQEGPSALSNTYYKAETYRLTGRVVLAMEAYEKLVQSDEYAEAAHYQLARLHFEQGSLYPAFQYASNGAALFPENTWMLRLKAQCAKQLGDTKSAGAAFEALAELQPGQPEYLFDAFSVYLQGNAIEDALRVLGTVAREYGTTPELVSDQVSLYLQQNDAKSAEKVLLAAVKEHPSVPEYYGLLSQFYDGNGKGKKAIKLLEKAVERFPLNGALHMELARISQRYGKTAQAMYHMEQGLVLDGVPIEDLMPVALSIYQNRANPEFGALYERVAPVLEKKYEGTLPFILFQAEIYLQEERYEEAMQLYVEAIELDPKNYELYQIAYAISSETGDWSRGLLILTLIELNFHDQGEIMDALAYEFYSIKAWESCARVALERAALTLDPEMAGGLYALAGTALFQLDSVQPGSQAYEKALVLDRSAANLNNYAWDLATHDANLEYALALTQESNDLQTLEPTYLDTWAWVLYKLGRYDEAREKIKVALQLLRTTPDAVMYRHAAAIEEAAGNSAQAEEYRDKAKALNGAK